MPAAADRQDLCAPVMVALRAAVAFDFAADRGRIAAESTSDLTYAEASFKKLCRLMRSSCVKCV